MATKEWTTATRVYVTKQSLPQSHTPLGVNLGQKLETDFNINPKKLNGFTQISYSYKYFVYILCGL